MQEGEEKREKGRGERGGERGGERERENLIYTMQDTHVFMYYYFFCSEIPVFIGIVAGFGGGEGI